MHSEIRSFSELAAGTVLGPLRLTVSAAANERYWRAAGVDHPTLAAGALYPPIAANLTVLCFAQVFPDAVIQTRQHLRCHRRVTAGVELVTTGRVARRYEKRGERLSPDLMRDYRLYVACQTDDDLPYVLKYAGEDNLVIGSDYGHADTATEIEALRRLKEQTDIAPSAIDKILDDNARALYGL